MAEQVCQKLTPGEADELRVEVKAILKKTQPPRHNLTKEEQKAIGELKRDNTRVILTADSGVSLVVMDKEQYINKAEELLKQPTYKTISSDPTTKDKNKLISLLKTIKAEGGMSEALYKRLYPTEAGSPKFYGLPKVHKEGIPLRPIVSSIGAVSYIQRAFQDPEAPGGEVSTSCPQHSGLYWTNKRHQAERRSMYGVLLCQGTVHHRAYSACPQYHPKITRKRQRTPTKDNHVCEKHHHIAGVLFKEHILYLPRQVLWTARRGCNGLSNKSHCGKHIYGRIWNKSHQFITSPPISMDAVCRWHLHHH